MANFYLFLGLLLVPLMGLDGARGPCPTPCRCSLEIPSCSRITDPPGIHQIPLSKLAAHPHPFAYLYFTGNAISSIGKEAWDAYLWAEYLVLKNNSLSRPDNSSLEGWLSLTYLDLSCNKIQITERNVFEAVPFLQIINLSGNVIEWTTEGTFQAWHGMQFLLKVDFCYNPPLAVIEDPYFYRLPSLKLLDLGATKATPRMLEDLRLTSLQLRRFILPKKMPCCLCHIKEDIEVLCKTIQLQCTETCDMNATVCENEEPLNRMQKEVMKVLDIRKLNGSSLLTILPETAIPNNTVLERTEHNSNTLAYSSKAADFNLLQSVKQLMQMEGGESLDVNWADKSEVKQLCLLVGLLEAALKEKIMALDKDSPEATVQNELSAQDSEKAAEETTKRSLKRHISFKKDKSVRKIRRVNWLGTNQRSKATLFRLDRDRREFARAATQSADQPSIFESHNMAEGQRKLVEGPGHQHAFSFFRPWHAGLQPSQKHSISDFLTNALNLMGSITVDKNNNDLTSLFSDGNSVGVYIK